MYTVYTKWQQDFSWPSWGGEQAPIVDPKFSLPFSAILGLFFPIGGGGKITL